MINGGDGLRHPERLDLRGRFLFAHTLNASATQLAGYYVVRYCKTAKGGRAPSAWERFYWQTGRTFSTNMVNTAAASRSKCFCTFLILLAVEGSTSRTKIKSTVHPCRKARDTNEKDQ